MADGITDEYIRRSLTLLRGAEGEAVAVSVQLRVIHEAIIADIAQVFEDAAVNRSPKKLTKLKKQVDGKLSDFYKGQWPEELREIESEVVVREIAWNTATVAAATEATLVSPRIPAVTKRAAKRVYQGKTFAKWVSQSYPASRKRVYGTLTNGYNRGLSVQEMTREMKGVLGHADRDVRTITRSFFMHNATEAKESVFNLNTDLVEGKLWLSTLDSRTTPLICGIRDGLQYTLENEPVGHSLSWDGGPGRIHWNCRSTSSPKLKDIKEPAQKRPSIGAGKNYERGDNVTRTGRVRKPNKPARDKGTYKIDIKTSRTKYEGWLREQSKHNIDFVADVLGSTEKARAFRDGTATLSSLRALSPVANPLNRTLI